MSQALKAVELQNRALIIIEGDDRYDFLQGLITQDITKLDNTDLIYACLLTPQGKFLHDMFLFNDNNQICIDCEGHDRAEDLYQRLKKYKLRSRVIITPPQPLAVHQVWHGHIDGARKDPRHDVCGYRLYNYDQPIETQNFDEWDYVRIQNTIPDGSRDLIVERSFIHEGRLDELNAVSYTKGCYVGQELVSRMHHRGLAKKHLKCVSLKSTNESFDIRSQCKDIALALVKINPES